VRRVVLKESQAPYTLTIGEEVLSEEPLILERDGKAVAAVIPMAEYEAFRAWREAAERERGFEQDLPALKQEQQAFLTQLDAIRQVLRVSGYRFRSKEEIDTQIETEREHWER
jgi:hypothetical protein